MGKKQISPSNQDGEPLLAYICERGSENGEHQVPDQYAEDSFVHSFEFLVKDGDHRGSNIKIICKTVGERNSCH
jgi:hypothetical protein